MPLRQALGRAALSLCLCAALLCGAAPARAQTSITLDIPAARNLARDALQAGDAALAGAIADGLLQRDPNDSGALLIKAAIALRMNRPAETRALARQAHRSATDPVLRYEAARFVAAAAVAEGRLTLAQVWLRRASSAAPAPAQYADTVAAFRQVQARNPLRLTGNFQITPSSNINQGSSAERLIIDGVPTVLSFTGDSQALSGLEFGVDLGASYRLAASPQAQTDLNFRLIANTYTLSSAAELQAPDAEGSDYAYVAAELGLRHAFVTAPREGPWSLGILAGQNWYGGQVLGQYLRADVGKAFRLSPTLTGRADLLVERQWRAERFGADSTVVALQGQLTRSLRNGDRLAFKLGLVSQTSPDRNAENTAISADIRYAMGRPVGPAQVTLGLTASARDYPTYFNDIFNETGRRDLRLGLSIDLTFPRAEVWGFAPVVSLSAGRTNSNVSRFDSDYLGVEFGFRSAF